PFLEAPAKLDGTLVGDVGFDPLGLSATLDVKYLRAAELKHGRIAMLAALGFVVQEILAPKQSGPFTEPDPFLAIYKVPVEGWYQIIAAISLVELVTFKENYDGSAEPGNFGFDPLGLGKDKSVFDKYALSELKNGRLAMIAWTAFAIQQIVTGKGVIKQLMEFQPL
nr:Chain 22, Chlorophyll a-b binding protein of LHCII type III, chloroplastic [Porphyridium purpureum]7Y5E_2N Chain 2N, Chlorophyll a-b binding protein of LHCII type III, chloroplastic [Porphyridium purpureum]7Y7A_27 Chain 27, Chlorophyll a-b binding protein of LHCII type III, chloroplastic [Porphyridium purpureum]7Y7A_2o Chain 2o, Chlorophyll a-b binding protein of LHCII type III, chloroplastic [Porphyridium purpureum]